MDWHSLLAGAFIGALVSVVVAVLVQNFWIPRLINYELAKREERRLRDINQKWHAFEQLFPALRLAQAGWQRDGTFASVSVSLRMGDPYLMPEDIGKIRSAHEREWQAAGFVDGEQVGISALRIYRVSDEPAAERKGESHVIEIFTHPYRYFDFLATHRLLQLGAEDEVAVLREYVKDPSPEDAINGFPNPLSVGLTLFCEGGRVLVLTVRSKVAAAGGAWHGGKLFNAVGENAAPVDFSAAYDGTYESSPIIVARRGLFQEMGFSPVDLNETNIRLHSLAWASDILDHKFFGVAISHLSTQEVMRRWEYCHDKSESRTLSFRGVNTREASLGVWYDIRNRSGDWAPEASFSTVRSLLVLGKLQPRDLIGAI